MLLINLSQEDFTIKNSERIAQIVIAAHSNPILQEVEILNDTQRGSGGFGSTGKK